MVHTVGHRYLAPKISAVNNLLPLLVFFVGLSAGCARQTTDAPSETRQPSRWVNPFIGTDAHGHTYPGATRPFGLVQLSPDTRLDGWDGCSAYHYSDSMIYGFSHTHLQGTGVSDYGDILFMPTNNSVHSGANWGERYRSRFNKNSEAAHAGYYTVHLDDHELTAELTATTRVGIHRYTFDRIDTCVLFIDMEHRDELISYQIEPHGDTLLTGFRRSSAWAEDQIIYFAAAFSSPFEFLDQTYEVSFETDLETGVVSQVMADVPVFPLRFGMTDTLMIKVALSSTGIEGALKNLEAEAPHWNFDGYRADAEAEWDHALSAIDIDTTAPDERTVFYTALYHSLTVPNTWSDVDGSYRGTDNQVHAAAEEGLHTYTVFSLWDTFRATHPLYTLIQQGRTRAFIHTMLNMYQQMGALPVWELAANETGCMIGYHSVPVIVDAFSKGITDFDHGLALEAMLAASNADELGKRPFRELGYIPSEMEHESVSKTLEYGYDDWCIARFAEAIGAEADIVAEYDRRSLAYRNLFNPQSGFIQPRRGGSFIEGFDPTEVNFNYTEANGWQYNFFAPHDINGHIDLLGGDEAYYTLLNDMFTTDATVSGRDQADITGLIGQYAHGNEPSHHMAYLFNYVGSPWRTQELVHRIMNELYTPHPDGLSGNEDCGQMSSWFVFSALGFYPVTPGSDVYVFGTPRYGSTLNLETGKRFTIRALREKKEDIYIQSVTLNGAPYPLSYIRHGDIVKGGELEFVLGSSPSKFGRAPVDRPVVRTHDREFVPAPIINAPRSFKGSIEVSLDCADGQAELFYAIVNPLREGADAYVFEPYVGPLVLDRSAVLFAYSQRESLRSAVVRSEITHIDHDRSVTVTPTFDHQYAAGGINALIDGIKGGPNFKTGEWQGFFGSDVDVVVDLGEVHAITNVRLGSVQDIRPWIWAPLSVSYSLSADGTSFTAIGTVHRTLAPDDDTPAVERFELKVGSVNARYVKAHATSSGSIPDWHLGAGNPSWMFLDEIEIETR